MNTQDPKHPAPVTPTTVEEVVAHLLKTLDEYDTFSWTDMATATATVNGLRTYLRWTWWVQPPVERAHIDIRLHKDEADALCARFAGCTALEGYYMDDGHRMPYWESGGLFSDPTPVAEAVLFFSTYQSIMKYKHMERPRIQWPADTLANLPEHAYVFYKSGYACKLNPVEKFNLHGLHGWGARVSSERHPQGHDLQGRPDDLDEAQTCGEVWSLTPEGAQNLQRMWVALRLKGAVKCLEAAKAEIRFWQEAEERLKGKGGRS